MRKVHQHIFSSDENGVEQKNSQVYKIYMEKGWIENYNRIYMSIQRASGYLQYNLPSNIKSTWL